MGSVWAYELVLWLQERENLWTPSILPVLEGNEFDENVVFGIGHAPDLVLPTHTFGRPQLVWSSPLGQRQLPRQQRLSISSLLRHDRAHPCEMRVSL
ncbi:unnamed protein product [Calypogeia fissa]